MYEGFPCFSKTGSPRSQSIAWGYEPSPDSSLCPFRRSEGIKKYKQSPLFLFRNCLTIQYQVYNMFFVHLAMNCLSILVLASHSLVASPLYSVLDDPIINMDGLFNTHDSFITDGSFDTGSPPRTDKPFESWLNSGSANSNEVSNADVGSFELGFSDPCASSMVQGDARDLVERAPATSRISGEICIRSTNPPNAFLSEFYLLLRRYCYPSVNLNHRY